MTSRGHLILKLLRKPEGVDDGDGDKTIWEAMPFETSHDHTYNTSNQGMHSIQIICSLKQLFI